MLVTLQRYNKDLCQQIVEQGKKIEPQDAIIGFSGSNVDTRVRRSKVRWITRDNQELGWLYHEITNLFHIANQGSTRSGKTYSISQLLALYIPHKEKVTISVVSPSLPHLKRGARRDILKILEDAGLYSDDNFNCC